MATACPSPALGAQPQPSSSEGKEQRSGELSLLWLANLTGADIGLPPIPQDPDDRCTIWENLVSLVDFQCPGEFPLTSEEICEYIDIPRASSSSSSSLPPPQAAAWSPPPAGDIDYQSNPHARPPYSYATLICMAMEASHKAKLTLADICKWIRDNFSYFRRAHPSWQSSIRHNLCINKRFVKVPREKGDPGRGAYWKLHPQYAEWLKNSSSEGRKALPEQIPPASGRRTQQGARRAPSPARSTHSGLEVGAELQRLLQEFEEFESTHNCDAVGNEDGQQCPQPCSMPEGQQCPQPCPMPEGQQCPQPCPMPEGQQCPQPCPMPEGQQCPQPCPTPPAEVSCLPGSAPGNPEEPGGLTELKGSADWEALFSPCLEPDFSTLDHLELPSFSPSELFPFEPAGEQGQPLGWPQGEQQTLPGPSLTKPGSDETLAAAAFLEAAWNEEITENLPSCFPVEVENLQPSLSSADVVGWDSLDTLKSLLDAGDEMNFDWI